MAFIADSYRYASSIMGRKYYQSNVEILARVREIQHDLKMRP